MGSLFLHVQVLYIDEDNHISLNTFFGKINSVDIGMRAGAVFKQKQLHILRNGIRYDKISV